MQSGEPGSAGTALLIAAHPDDAEFGSGGTVARWTREGWRVVYLICTRGEQGTHDPHADLAALARLREEEQRAAAHVLGVTEVDFLGYADGLVQPTLELRRDLTREIRRYRPQRVICPSPLRLLDSSSLRRNHPDHMAVGEATLAAIYPTASSPHLFPELLAAGFEPWIVPEIWVTESGNPDTVVDISATIDLKIAALQAHASQVGEDIEPRIREWGRLQGEPHGFAAGEGYRVIHLT
jgi:LmbE family N-acetylglucosaminyl deacetylase